MPRFEKFSERARRVLSWAQEEAQRFNHNYIGTEHILLALIREKEGVAVKILTDLGVELSSIQSTVEFTLGRSAGMSVGEIGLTGQARKVIELAVAEARQLEHHYIGTQHLLIGVMCEGEGVGAGVLGSLGVTPEKLRESHKKVLARDRAKHQTARPSSDWE